MMKTATRIRYLSIVLVAPLTTAIAIAETPPSSSAPPSSERSEAMVEKMSSTATVEKVDTANRRLTLKDEQGKQFTVTVPEEVSRLDEIKKGDRIKLDYYESIGISLQKGAAGAQPSAGETTTMSREGTKLPSGHMARRITASAQVTKVDRAKDEVTLKAPNGELHTIHVTDPAMKDNLAKLKKGDRIQATYTEAIAVSVERPAKKKAG